MTAIAGHYLHGTETPQVHENHCGVSVCLSFTEKQDLWPSGERAASEQVPGQSVFSGN
jgi:hypothetical protein